MNAILSSSSDQIVNGQEALPQISDDHRSPVPALLLDHQGSLASPPTTPSCTETGDPQASTVFSYDTERFSQLLRNIWIANKNSDQSNADYHPLTFYVAASDPSRVRLRRRGVTVETALELFGKWPDANAAIGLPAGSATAIGTLFGSEDQVWELQRTSRKKVRPVVPNVTRANFAPLSRTLALSFPRGSIELEAETSMYVPALPSPSSARPERTKDTAKLLIKGLEAASLFVAPAAKGSRQANTPFSNIPSLWAWMGLPTGAISRLLPSSCGLLTSSRRRWSADRGLSVPATCA
jgi:hypothetical protein